MQSDLHSCLLEEILDTTDKCQRSRSDKVDAPLLFVYAQKTTFSHGVTYVLRGLNKPGRFFPIL